MKLFFLAALRVIAQSIGQERALGIGVMESIGIGVTAAGTIFSEQ